jgi:transcriptional regulator with XRE-family HTH domain
MRGGAGSYFGRQLRREREAAGWTLTELGRRSGINPAHLGRIESGDRPPTGNVADALDTAWPRRHHFWRSLFDDSQGWREIPSGFRNWAEHEAQTATLDLWQPGLVDGTFQTRAYAAAVLATEPLLDEETRAARLEARMHRAQRLTDRLRGVSGRPLLAVVLVDAVALIRDVGGPAVMAEQMRYLLEVAALPAVVLQVVPVRAHAALASGYLVTDSAVWAEHVLSGGVYVDDETIRGVRVRNSNLRGEAHTASESRRMIEEAATSWQNGRPPVTGASPPGAPDQAASA